MRIHSQALIGRVSRWLQALGWSARASQNGPSGERQWRVDATHRSGGTVSASAVTQSGAWDIACRLAARTSLSDSPRDE
jgi:hypothetical protein